jgi:transposase
MLPQDNSIPPIPALTLQVARAAFPKTSTFMLMRDTLGSLFVDEDFACLFPCRGQPALSPWRLALVTIMQFVEGLSDRQAAEAVRSRIDWKYALSLDLTDPGFDFSVLCEFRQRLMEGGAEKILLDKLLEQSQQVGLLKASGQQRTDSTHVLAAIRKVGRLECMIETLRYALNAVAEVAPVWLRALAPSDWYERYSKRIEESRLPRNPQEREALARRVGADGLLLIDSIYSQEAPALLRQLPAVETLRQLWLQQFYAPDPTVRWRSQEDRPPCAQQIRSPYDIEARYATKRTTHWTGYKVHLSETCEEDAPRLITHVETTGAPVADQWATPIVHQALKDKELLPNRHLVDAGYTSVQLIVSAQQDYGVELLGPVPTDRHWQAQEKQGFAADSFTVDWKKQVVYCPQGKASCRWKPDHDPRGNPTIYIAFARQECQACPVRSQCTRSKKTGRSLTLRAQSDGQALQQARARQKTDEFKTQYAQRAGIEGSISQAVRAFGLRRCRYIGFAKTRLQHIVTAAAMNVVRLAAWLRGEPLAQTRQSSFAQLAKAG